MQANQDHPSQIGGNDTFGASTGITKLVVSIRFIEFSSHLYTTITEVQIRMIIENIKQENNLEINSSSPYESTTLATTLDS